MNESLLKTLTVSTIVSLVCAIFISTTVVLLRPTQTENIELDKQKNILQAAGLYDPERSITEQFASIEAKVINLRNGTLANIDADSFDPIKSAKTVDPNFSISIQELGIKDIAKINRRENQSVVYLVKKEGQLNKIILPIRGYGLWSTLYGFLALESDASTVAGIGFYQHGETPGLGGEIDNPRWKKSWIGKKIYRDNHQFALTVIKGKVLPNHPQKVHQIDGLSGATLTTRGVNNLIRFWLGHNGFQPFLNRLRQNEIL